MIISILSIFLILMIISGRICWPVPYWRKRQVWIIHRTDPPLSTFTPPTPLALTDHWQISDIVSKIIISFINSIMMIMMIILIMMTILIIMMMIIIIIIRIIKISGVECRVWMIQWTYSWRSSWISSWSLSGSSVSLLLTSSRTVTLLSSLKLTFWGKRYIGWSHLLIHCIDGR